MRRRTLAITLVLFGGAALVLFCCGGSDRRAADATGTPPRAVAPVAPAVPAVAPAPSAARPATALPEPSASVASAAASDSAPATPSSAPAGTSIVQAVKSSDPRDLELLASVERELKRDPPPEIHALVAARKRGASRAELTAAIQRLPDLQLRVLAERWLDKVAPRPR